MMWTLEMHLSSVVIAICDIKVFVLTVFNQYSFYLVPDLPGVCSKNWQMCVGQCAILICAVNNSVENHSLYYTVSDFCQPKL